jgi:hypothetical protein
MINECNSSRHEKINTPMSTHNSWQPRTNCRIWAGRSVIEDTIERNSWEKSGCEWMCRFLNTGGLHGTSRDAPLETHTPTNNTSLQLRTNCVCPHHCCCFHLRPPPLFTSDCAAVAMAAVDSSNISHPQWKRQLMAAAAMVSLLLPSTPMKEWWQRHQQLLHS